MKKRFVAGLCVCLFLLNLFAACSKPSEKNASGLRTNNTSFVMPVIVENTTAEVNESTIGTSSLTDNISEDTNTEIVEVTLRNTDDWVLDLEKIDVDLTLLSSTMVYTEVYNMLTNPDEYIGKTIRMTGKYIAYTNQYGNKYYPAIIIADATACCSQGMEFVLDGNPPYPEGYPMAESEATVVGIFDTYEENGILYCHLIKAIIE